MGLRTYAVLGTGAVGGFYGARLAAAGHTVHFLLRSDYDHVRRHGLRVESPLGDVHLRDPLIHSDPATIPPVDVALVCTKTTAPPPLPPRAEAVVLMQNGLGNEAAVEPRLPPGTPLLGGLCFLCSNKVGPGHVRHLDEGRVTLAQHRATTITPTVDGIAGDLEAAHVPVIRGDNLELARWRKLVWNVPFNPLTTLLDAYPQDLLNDPRLRALVDALMKEVQQGAAAVGQFIDDRFIETTIADTVVMRPYLTSMKLDADAGRPLETAAILDAPAQAARRAGTPLPRIETLAALLSRDSL